jgi:hypothetical protein
LLPEEQFEPGRMRKNMAMLGAGLGALPGAATGLAQARIPEAGGSDQPGFAKYLNPTPWLSGYSWKGAMFDKMAADFAAQSGGVFLPTIPVDAFNRAIWNDVRAIPNRFGTKSPWGDNSQPLSTPPPVAAAASGLLSGAAALTGRDRVSPFQVATAAGLAAGKGLLGGMAVGKVFGALAGLRPEAQAQLQRAGTWAGLITGAVNGLFR